MKLLKFFALLFFCFFCSGVATASVSLDIMPLDGSRSLHFGKGFSDSGIQVRVRVNASSGERYQVFQRVQDPIVNQKGQSLDLQSIQTEGSINSNASGTLYLQQQESVGYSDQLIYSSAQNGESDSFVVGYILRPDMMSASGNFNGQFVYTVRSLTNGDQQQVTLPVSLEAVSHWVVSVGGSRRPDRVVVEPKQSDINNEEAVRIIWSGNNSQEIRLYQEVDLMPQSSQGQEILSGSMQFLATGDQVEGLALQDRIPLDYKRVLVYAGKASEASLVLNYFFTPALLASQEAGSYTGKLRFVVERSGELQSFFVNLECVINPVFSMDIEMPAGGVNFPRILPNQPAAEKEVVVRVTSNLHKPYQVVQLMGAPMTNEKGRELEAEFFTMKGDLLEGTGQIHSADFAPVKAGEYPVFTSDNRGSSAAFKVVYRIQGYPQMDSGNFLAPIRFSLNQN